jgi:predicted nucleotidyltransferase
VRDILLPLLNRERRLFERLLGRLRQVIGGQCSRAIVFGSTARGEDVAESDLDLLMIAADRRMKRSVRVVAEEARAVLLKEWGARLNPVVLTEREFCLRSERRDPLVSNIMREGIDLYSEGPGGETCQGAGGGEPLNGCGGMSSSPSLFRPRSF